MKKVLVFCFVFVLVMTGATGCGGTKSPTPSANEGISTKAEENKQAEAPVNPPETPENSGALDAVRKSAEDSGYNVYDEHQLVFLSDVKDGFSVEITADSQTTVYSFIECETDEAAVKNAKDIDNAGYNIAIRGGRLLTCYAVDKRDRAIKDILSSLLEGKPVNKKLYDGSNADQPEPMSSEQAPETVNPAPSEQANTETIAGTWASGTIPAGITLSPGSLRMYRA